MAPNVGDLIAYERTGRVISSGPVTFVEDEMSGFQYSLPQGTEIEVLEYAKPAVRKLNVGSVLTNSEVASLKWKPGSVIQNVDTPEYVILSRGKGSWVNQTGEDFAWTDEPDDEDLYRVLYVA